MTPSQPLLRAICHHVIRVTALSTLSFCTACANFSQAGAPPPLPPTAAIPATSVVALGRLTPKGEVIKLSVSNAEDSRVNQLLVEEGDWVKAGQVIAVLQGIEGRERDLEEALKSVDYYRARLEQVRAGDAKAAEIAAQQANIARLEAQLQSETEEREAAIASAVAALRQAEINYHRKQVLQQQGAVSREELDLAQEEFEMAQATLAERRAQLSNTVQTLRQQITQEQENLARLREIRPVDVRVAQAELERAMIAVEQRRADLEDTKVRVPVAGQILRINTRVGEQVNTQQGIVELGRTDEMYAIAEVYETEIMKVRQGQRATLSSEYGGFAGKIHGTVDHIGLQIGTRTLTEASSNPTTDENTRVVEVKIRIDPQDSKAIAGLTNMQVRVEIDTTSRSET